MIKLRLGHEPRTHGWDAGRKIFDVGRHTFDSRQNLGHEPRFKLSHISYIFTYTSTITMMSLKEFKGI